VVGAITAAKMMSAIVWKKLRSNALLQSLVDTAAQRKFATVSAQAVIKAEIK
jgi:hypothetical protein